MKEVRKAIRAAINKHPLWRPTGKIIIEIHKTMMDEEMGWGSMEINVSVVKRKKKKK